MDISLCSRRIGERIFLWDVSVLQAAARDLPVRYRALADFDLSALNFFASYDDANLASVVAHIGRIDSADLTQPIILDTDGTVLDGLHRLAKATVTGATSIATVQFTVAPAPLRIIETGG